MKKIFLTLFLATVIVLTANISYALPPYYITQITDNDYDDKYPEINDNGDMVWVEEGGSIVYYDGSTTTQIGHYNAGNILDMNNNGSVVWATGVGSVSEIYLYNGSTTTPLTSNSYDDTEPCINNNGEVVWMGETSTDAWDLYFYDGSTTTQFTNGGIDRDPDINDNGDIAWNIDYVVNVYDGSTITPLPTPLTWNTYPSINNSGEVAWMAWDGDYEIYLYDGFLTRLTDNSYWDVYPDINDNGYIVWGGRGNNSEIYVYDGSTITPFTSNSFPDGWPDINNNDDIVWSGYDGNDWEIYKGTVIPEPSSLLLLGFGLLGAGLLKRKKI